MGGFAINSENQPIAYLTNFPFAQKFDIPLKTDGFNGEKHAPSANRNPDS